MSFFLPSKGPANAKLMVIGDFPEKVDAQANSYFSSQSGGILLDSLIRGGINQRDCYFTNVSTLRPPSGHVGDFIHRGSGIPLPVLANRLVELYEEINSVNPNCILAMGDLAIWAVTHGSECIKWNKRLDKKSGHPAGFSGSRDWRGSIVQGNAAIGGRKVVCSDHPRTVVFEQPRRIFFLSDVARAVRQSAFDHIERPNYTITVDPKGEDRMAWRDKLIGQNLLSADIEWVHGKLVCTSFCNRSDEVLVLTAEDPFNERLVREILESGTPLCFQNGMFDASVLEWHKGWRVFEHIKHDTMLAAHAAYVELPKDLGTLCSLYTEQPCYWTQVKWRDIASGKQPISTLYKYNGIDSWVTHEVARQQLSDELKEPRTKKVFDYEMSLLQPLWDMAKIGVPLDARGWEEMRAANRVEIQNGLALLKEMNGGKAINLSSPPQMRKFIYETLGFPGGKKGDTDDKTLADLGLKAKTERQRSGILILRSTKRAISLESKLFNLRLDSDGRFRSHYNPAGTNTWRLSSKKFFPTDSGNNGQNVPKKQTRILVDGTRTVFNPRKLFKPDPGYVMMYHDLERAESYVVAQITGDPLMLAHHQPNVDAHRLLAAELYGKAPEEVNDVERYMGKQTRHAGNYMQQWKTFMINLNKYAEETGIFVDAKQAKELIGKYHEMHVMLPRWWADVKDEYNRQGYLENLFGFRRTFYDRFNQPALVAFKPQSTVGVAVNMAMRKLWADERTHELGIQMLMQIHDALCLQVPKSNLDAALEVCADCMAVPILNPRTGEEFVIPIELTAGPSWGECEKIRTVHH